MKIRRISIREIFDSRGEPTIEVSLRDGAGRIARASVPSGKSKGKKEAKSLPFPMATRALRTLQPYLTGREFSSQKELDERIIRADGTKDKSKLGGNLLLGVSMAFTRARAAESGQEPWEILRNEFFPELRSTLRQPYIFSNVINGGSHADNNLDIQEYMLAAFPETHIASAVGNLIKIYHELGAALAKKNKGRVPKIGDEGGYSPDFKDGFEPVDMLSRLISNHRLARKFGIALDAAAGSFYAGGKYKFGGKTIPGEKLQGTYAAWFKKSPALFSIEDPFAEDDISGFSALRAELPEAWIVGDDLTATNPRSISRFAESGAINAVIIKPNQIGTISEAAEAMLAAKKAGVKTIVSHRSGETEDVFIIHLARAGNADALKIGAPARERMLKYNELLRLYSPV